MEDLLSGNVPPLSPELDDDDSDDLFRSAVNVSSGRPKSVDTVDATCWANEPVE